MALVLVLLFAANMPDSVVRSGLLVVAEPVLNVAGLGPGMGRLRSESPAGDRRGLRPGPIAPTERSRSTRSRTTSGISEYWNYRWSKLGEQLQRNDRVPERAAFARWVADRDRGAGGRPERVTLVRRIQLLPPPGQQQPEFGPPRDVPFFRLEIAP